MLEMLNQVKIKELLLIKSRFIKIKKGKKLYENVEELVVIVCDQNKGNIESKKINDIKLRNIKEIKFKFLVFLKFKK